MSVPRFGVRMGASLARVLRPARSERLRVQDQRFEASLSFVQRAATSYLRLKRRLDVLLVEEVGLSLRCSYGVVAGATLLSGA